MPASPEDPDDEGAQKPNADSNSLEEKEDDDISLDNITEPRESDVICGRGGAALRHPGNQTYRRLVNLNKGLYITCLKTEKLKISRSIVAAIREQRGRFLERNAKAGTWFDIGDKKAVEKTSQALREGQPKLRQKMVEMGSSAPHVIPGMSTQQQLSHHQQQAFAASGLTAGQFSQAQSIMPQPNQTQSDEQGMPPPPSRINSNTTVETNTDLLLQRLSINSNANDSLPVSVTSAHMSTNSGVVNNNNNGGNINQRPSFKSRLRPSLMQRGLAAAQELGIQDSNLSLMSGFSDFSAISSSGMSLMNNANNHQHQHQHQNQHQHQHQHQNQHQNGNNHPLMTASIGSNILSNASASNFGGSHSGNMTLGSASDFGMSSQQQMSVPASPGPQAPMTVDTAMRHFDRRRLFAKMKYTRPASGRFGHPNGSHQSQHGGGIQPNNNMTTMDGMPDIHPVESNFSLLSNMSTSVTDVKPAAMNLGNSNNSMGTYHSLMQQQQQQQMQQMQQQQQHQDQQMQQQMQQQQMQQQQMQQQQMQEQQMQQQQMQQQQMQEQQMQQQQQMQMQEQQQQLPQHQPVAMAVAAAKMSSTEVAPINDQQQQQQQQQNNDNDAGMSSLAPVNDMAREFRDFVSVSGSRRSLMSGLSRISDTSDVNSIFSDLSKKIGNVSTRSIAMSEISGIDEVFNSDDDDDDDGEFQIDLIPVPAPAPSSSSVASGGMDFDL